MRRIDLASCLALALFVSTAAMAQPSFGVRPSAGARGAGQLFWRDGGKTSRVYDFCRLGEYCDDGKTPVGTVLQLQDGTLVGVTQGGGTNNSGLLFRLRHKFSHWKLTHLYDFCGQFNCQDGAQPVGDIALDGPYIIVGSTAAQGWNGAGTSWRYDIRSHRFNVLKNFKP